MFALLLNWFFYFLGVFYFFKLIIIFLFLPIFSSFRFVLVLSFLIVNFFFMDFFTFNIYFFEFSVVQGLHLLNKVFLVFYLDFILLSLFFLLLDSYFTNLLLLLFFSFFICGSFWAWLEPSWDNWWFGEDFEEIFLVFIFFFYLSDNHDFDKNSIESYVNFFFMITIFMTFLNSRHFIELIYISFFFICDFLYKHSLNIINTFYTNKFSFYYFSSKLFNFNYYNIFNNLLTYKKNYNLILINSSQFLSFCLFFPVLYITVIPMFLKIFSNVFLSLYLNYYDLFLLWFILALYSKSMSNLKLFLPLIILNFWWLAIMLLFFNCYLCFSVYLHFLFIDFFLFEFFFNIFYYTNFDINILNVNFYYVAILEQYSILLLDNCTLFINSFSFYDNSFYILNYYQVMLNNLLFSYPCRVDNFFLYLYIFIYILLCLRLGRIVLS